MPYFEIEGYGKETKRKRKRTYTAKDREEAIRLAAQEGTIAEHVTMVEVMGFMPNTVQIEEEVAFLANF